MNESIVEMQRLLKEVIGHVQADTKAETKGCCKVGTHGRARVNLGADAQGAGVEFDSSPDSGFVRNPTRPAHTSLCDGGSTLFWLL